MDFKTRFKGKISLEHPLAKQKHAFIKRETPQRYAPGKSNLRKRLPKQNKECMNWRQQQQSMGEAIHDSNFHTFTRKSSSAARTDNSRLTSNRLKMNPSSFSAPVQDDRRMQEDGDVSDTTTEEEPLKRKRVVQYKPYRLKNLKALPEVKELPKGTGPTEIPSLQMARREHMLNYASQVYTRNKLTKRVRKIQAPRKKSKYEIAREFAKTIQKPKLKQSSEERKEEERDERAVQRTLTEIERLAMKNEDARRQVQLLGLNF